MRLGMIDSALIVANQASALVEPAKGPLYDPALSDKLEAFGVIAAADDLQVQPAEWAQSLDPLDQRAGIAAIGPEDLQPAKEKIESREQMGGSIAVLHRGGSHAHPEDQAEGIYHNMPLAPADLLARIVADRRAALFGAFDTLTVEDGRTRRRLAPLGDAHFVAQGLVEPLPQSDPAPRREVFEDRGPRREVIGQQPPLAAGAVEIEDGVEDHPAWMFDRSSARFGLRNPRLDNLPFLVGEITGVTLGWVHPKRDG